MDTEAIQKYEAALKALRAELQAEIDQPHAESAPVEVDNRMGRISRGDAMQVQQLALEVKRRREERLLRVRSALQRIQQGSYGLCGRCRNPIAEPRLEVFPDAVLCVKCASTPKR